MPVCNNKTLIPLFVNRYLKMLDIEADLSKLSEFVANNKALNGCANPENVAGGIVFFFAELRKLNANMNEFMEKTKLTKKSINDSKKRIDKKWDWDYISQNPNITWEFVEHNSDKKWDWMGMSWNKFNKM